MARSTPQHCHHKTSGRGYVTLAGQQHYTGAFGTAEAEIQYHELVARWLAGGKAPLRRVTPEGPTVGAICERYETHAREYYRKNGCLTTEFRKLVRVLAVLRRLYGSTPAAEFTAADWETVRGHWLQAGIARGTINDYAGRVKRCFAWAARRQLIPTPSWLVATMTPGLRQGRTPAPDRVPIGPADERSVTALLDGLDGKPGVGEPCATMIRLQLLTGMRPGEVCRLRPRNLDREAAVWTYTDRDHKTAHLGGQRIILLGPRAQALLQPLLALSKAPEAPLFAGTRRDDAGRPLPLEPDSYRRRLTRACHRLEVPQVHPNQLRHSAATRLRKLCGLETTRIALGHSSSVTTEIYAERDRETLEQLVRDHG